MSIADDDDGCCCELRYSRLYVHFSGATVVVDSAGALELAEAGSVVFI